MKIQLRVLSVCNFANGSKIIRCSYFETEDTAYSDCEIFVNSITNTKRVILRPETSKLGRGVKSNFDLNRYVEGYVVGNLTDTVGSKIELDLAL